MNPPTATPTPRTPTTATPPAEAPKSNGAAPVTPAKVTPAKVTPATTPVRAWWQRPMLWAAVGAVLVISIGSYVAWRLFRTPEPPRMKDAPSDIAGFFDSQQYHDLPFERQVAYLKQVEAKEDELVESYRSGSLSDASYRKSLEAAYLGRHLTRMKKYFELPPGKARDAYLDKLLDKKEAEKAGASVTKKDGTKKPPKPNARDAKDVKAITRDESIEADIVKKWPAETQQQWKQYHAAADARKKLRKEEENKLTPGTPGEPSKGATPATPS
jgi:hypothetical protein